MRPTRPVGPIPMVGQAAPARKDTAHKTHRHRHTAAFLLRRFFCVFLRVPFYGILF